MGYKLKPSDVRKLRKKIANEIWWSISAAIANSQAPLYHRDATNEFANEISNRLTEFLILETKEFLANLSKPEETP